MPKLPSSSGSMCIMLVTGSQYASFHNVHFIMRSKLSEYTENYLYHSSATEGEKFKFS